MRKIGLLLFLFSPFLVISQNITGKVYDAETTVKGSKIFNKTKALSTYTNELGDFNIQASISDTLVFTSLFHKDKLVEVTPNHFEDTIVIELQKIINDLDEVLLSGELRENNFAPDKYSANTGLQIANDIKNKPHLYNAPQSSNLDFIKIAGLIKNLLFKKSKADIPTPIDYKALDSLFSESHFFTEKLLVNDLKISKPYKYLFFNYCDSKQINNKLLLEKNSVILLDTLIKCSNEFIKMLSDYETQHEKN